MPYTKISDVPKYVPKVKKKQWLKVFNSAYKQAKDKGMSDKDAEAQAFAEANGVTENDKKSQSQPMLERRFIRGGELRAKDGETPGIVGYGSVFNQAFDSGWFIETIKPGAFTRAISEKQDVRGLFNHNPDNLLARTRSGTMTLAEDATGLRFDMDVNTEATVGADVISMIQRGDLDGCSFGFAVRKQTWREEPDEDGAMIQYRDIEDLDLFDVGPVTYPAYTGTSVSERALWPHGIPDEVRSHVPKLAEDSAGSDRRYVSYVKGHKNSKGEDAPWVVKDHKTGDILSSHKTRKQAKKALEDMHIFEDKSGRSADPDGDGDDDEPLINAIDNLVGDAADFAQVIAAAQSEVDNGDTEDGPEALTKALEEAKELKSLLEEFIPLAEEELAEPDDDLERSRVSVRMRALEASL